MIVSIIRTLIIFIVLVIVMRLMGKRQIGEMQPFEFIITLIIADLACFPMADVSIPLLYGIVSVLALFILHQVLSLAEQSGDKLKHIISGKPSIVINKQGVDLFELKRNNMGVDDLIESMRSMGYFSLDDLDYAIFESNGKLSVLENTSKSPTPSALPLMIVSSGKLNAKNLNLLKITKEKLDALLQKLCITQKQIEIMTLDENGRAYIKQKNKKYIVENLWNKEINH